MKKELSVLIRKYNLLLIPINFIKAVGCVILIPLSLFCLVNIVPIMKMIGKGLADFGIALKRIFVPLPKKEFKEFENTCKGNLDGFSIKKGEFKFSANLLFVYSDFRFEVVPLNHILWAYVENKTVRTTGYNYPLTASAMRTDYVVVCTDFGKKIKYKYKQKALIQSEVQTKSFGEKDLMKNLVENCPYILFGYDKKINELYKSDRNKLIEQVNINKIKQILVKYSKNTEFADSKDKNETKETETELKNTDKF